MFNNQFNFALNAYTYLNIDKSQVLKLSHSDIAKSIIIKDFQINENHRHYQLLQLDIKENDNYISENIFNAHNYEFIEAEELLRFDDLIFSQVCTSKWQDYIVLILKEVSNFFNFKYLIKI